MKRSAMMLVLMFLALPPLTSSGADYSYLTPQELKGMFDRNEPGLLVIDSRGRSQYDEAHIKSAIAIPLDEMEQDASLPKAPKNAKLVFYCSGST